LYGEVFSATLKWQYADSNDLTVVFPVRRSDGYLSHLRQHFAARTAYGAAIFLHAGIEADGSLGQRAERARA
jgi:hypothetical protein